MREIERFVDWLIQQGIFPIENPSDLINSFIQYKIEYNMTLFNRLKKSAEIMLAKNENPSS